MHFVFPRLSTYLIIILIVYSSVLDPEVNMDCGSFFPKCGPHLIYIRITSSTEQFCFIGIRISKVVVASGNVHFKFGASNLNVWQSLNSQLQAVNLTHFIPHQEYVCNTHNELLLTKCKLRKKNDIYGPSFCQFAFQLTLQHIGKVDVMGPISHFKVQTQSV